MASAASRTLLALFFTFCAPRHGWTEEKPLGPQSGKQTAVDKIFGESWEPSIHLDGKPVDRFLLNTNKHGRSHRFTKVSKDSHPHPMEDVDPEWINLDGFAVLGQAPVNNSSTGFVRSSQTTARNNSAVRQKPRVDRTTQPAGLANTRTQRRAPQSSSGPRQPKRALAGSPLLNRRRQHRTKPQADQRNRQTAILTSESVHVVSLQAQKAHGRSLPNNREATVKTSPPEPPEYEARDISVRVMSPKSVLISWVDPAVEMGKVVPGASRSYTVRFREKGESARWEYKESTQRRMMIDTLSADSMYEFSVRISQGEKYGKWSVSVFQRTPESAPSGPPESFEVQPLRGKGTAVIATWDPPEEPNGRIREYILSYAPAKDPFGMKTLTYRESTTTATIDGLTPGENYIFKIRATNRRGMGPQSKTFSVSMPRSSNTASSLLKSKDSQKTSHSTIKQNIHETSSLEPPEVPEDPFTTSKPHNNKRRLPQLSQTRSYHSIFSLRGSVRNGVNRGSTRGAEREYQEKDEEKITTTQVPAVQTTPVVPETKEVDNNVSPLSEDDIDYEEEHLTTVTPSLRMLTTSTTKPAYKRPYRPNRRPIKIRVHQKTGSKDSSSLSSNTLTSSSSIVSSSSSSAASSVSSSAKNSFRASSSSSFPSLAESLLMPSSQIPHLAPSGKDNVDSTIQETKNIDQKNNPTSSRESLTTRKPLISVSSQETESIPTDTSSTGPERSRHNGSRSGSRYGYGRRKTGSLFRGNFTQLVSGHKPSVTPQLNLQSQNQNQAVSSTGSTEKKQSMLTGKRQNHETTNPSNPKSSKSTLGSASNSQTTSDSLLTDKSQFSAESRSHGSNILQGKHASTSLRKVHNFNADISGSSQSVSLRLPHSSTISENNQNSQGSGTSSNQDTSFSKKIDALDNNNKDNVEGKTEESNSRAQYTQEIRKEERPDESTSKKTVVSHTRISSSFAERFPWLASRYPGKFTSSSRSSSARKDVKTPLTRVSSSVGADRPLLKETPTRVSGAAGASGISLKQETLEIHKTTSRPDLLKNSPVLSSHKPSLPNQREVSSDTINPTIVSSSEMLTSLFSGSLSPEKTSEHRDSSDATHKEKSKSEDNSRYKVDTVSTEKNEKLTDPTAAQTNLEPPSIHRTAETSETGAKRETLSKTRSGATFGISPSIHRSGLGMNGRARSSFLANRQLGGSRLFVRPQHVQNSRLGGSTSDSSSMSSLNMRRANLTSASDADSGASSRDTFRNQGGRLRYPIIRGKPINRGKFKPGNGNGKNGKPNLTATDEKDTISSLGGSKPVGQKFITGPDGTRWVVDLEKGVLMNQDGQVLQDSQGKPKRVVLGEDGRTIFDHMGSPLVNQEGIALFGHGRDSQPVVNPKEKVLMVGGKPVLGLDVPLPRSSTTTTLAPTTTLEPATTDWNIEDFSTAQPYPTCPPGTFSKTDEFGYPLLDPEGILDCYPEEESSGMELDHMLTVAMMPDALGLEKDELLMQTTFPPTTTTIATTTTSTIATTTTTTAVIPTTGPQATPSNRGPLSEFDLSGKRRFTAPYVNYIQKDPNAPCSLTEALEYLQVDVLESLMEKDSKAVDQNQPPKHKPQNLTVVAMEGCHSFIILDWAKPLKDDMVSGYLVHSATYDDVLNNRWSSGVSSGTHLPVENLKPNSRYYFRVQAKNVYGLGPLSETLTYVTESDDPLLVARLPGGEPIWIPFTFKYNPAHTSCKGKQYVKRTWYKKFVGVVLCNSLRYKIFMADDLRVPFYSIGDTMGQGEDHCQFVDSHRDGRTGPAYLSENLPSAQGYYRAYRQEPVSFGVIGRRTSHPFVGWYECGVSIPGKW